LTNPSHDEVIDFNVKSKLEHGKIVLWHLGKDCHNTGDDTLRIKQILDENCLEYEEHNVADLSPPAQNQVRLALTMHTGYAQFPNVYFGEEHVGGYDDLVSYFQSTKTQERVMAQNGIQPSSSGTDVTDNEDVAMVRSFNKPSSTEEVTDTDPFEALRATTAMNPRERLLSM